MKILFLIASMRGGGAERVAATLCNSWVSSGHEVVLVTFDEAVNDFYTTDSKITRHTLSCFKTSHNKLEKVYSNLSRIWRLRNIIRNENPTVVVSFMDVANILAIVASLRLKVPVIVSERTYPPYYNHQNLFDKIRKFIYKFSDGFVAQTTNVAIWAQQFLPHDKICVIANPVDVQEIPTTQSERDNTILAVGRLGHEKGYDLLIQAFARVHADKPNWRLKIVGEGHERGNLTDQVQALGLGEKISLPGQTKQPQLEYAKAKIFVLSSRVEGFPNVLIEAMAHGAAPISFDCNSGPADIITHNENGLLVRANDVIALSEAIMTLINDAELTAKLSHAAMTSRHKYSLELISTTWLDLFAAVG